MPYDPNQDPRKGMSSGGPAPNQPTLPPAPQPWERGLGGTPASQPLGGPAASGAYPLGQPADFVTGIANTFGINPFGNPDNGSALPPTMQNMLNRPGAPGGAGDMAPVGGAPAIPQYLGPPGSGGIGGDVGTLQGLDFTQPGALEQYQRQMGGYFQQPTMSEMFAKDAIARGAGPGVSNRADEAYRQFSSSQPANMDPYYDNERRKAEEAIRRTMASRGSYGSSATDDLYNEMYTNLAADAAKANAQYGLQRNSLLGSLAQGADQSSLAGSGDRRNWMGALGGLAGQADQAGLSRVIGGGNLAGAAQGAQRTRGQDAFSNQLQMGDRMSGIMGQGYGDIFGTDVDLMKTITGLNTGTASEGYNQASQNAIQARQNVANYNNLFGGNLEMGRGLIDMFGGTKGGGSPQPSPMPAPTTSQEELPRNPYV